MAEEMRFKTIPFQQPGKLRIDRANLRIHDLVAMKANIEALGHGAESDMKTLEMTANLGNLSGRRIRARLGHPGASENTAGMTLGYSTDFRIVGDALQHDFQFMDSASISPSYKNDPIKYIMEIAEKHPTELAESVVIMCDTVWKLDDDSEFSSKGPTPKGIEVDADGRPLRATTRLPLLRPSKLSYIDFVGEGALTHGGLFTVEMAEHFFAGTGNEGAAAMFEALDYWCEELNLSPRDLPHKAQWIVERYLETRGYKEFDMPPKSKNVSLASEQTEIELIEADTLTAALAMAQETETALAEKDTVEEDVRYTQLEAQVRNLAATVEMLLGRVDGVQTLTELNTKNIRTLDRNIRVVDADPVVTLAVPRTPKSALAPMEFEAQVPPDRAALGKPQHTAERDGDLVEVAHVRAGDQDAQNSLLASQRRRASGFSSLS